MVTSPVADPGFELRVGVDFVNGGGGKKIVLMFEVKVIFCVFWPYFY